MLLEYQHNINTNRIKKNIFIQIKSVMQKVKMWLITLKLNQKLALGPFIPYKRSESMPSCKNKP